MATEIFLIEKDGEYLTYKEEKWGDWVWTQDEEEARLFQGNPENMVRILCEQPDNNLKPADLIIKKCNITKVFKSNKKGDYYVDPSTIVRKKSNKIKREEEKLKQDSKDLIKGIERKVKENRERILQERFDETNADLIAKGKAPLTTKPKRSSQKMREDKREDNKYRIQLQKEAGIYKEKKPKPVTV